MRMHSDIKPLHDEFPMSKENRASDALHSRSLPHACMEVAHEASQEEPMAELNQLVRLQSMRHWQAPPVALFAAAHVLAVDAW